MKTFASLMQPSKSGDRTMELPAIYHKPESEYAYLYKDKTMHIRIRTKKDDIKSISLHYGDPFRYRGPL